MEGVTYKGDVLLLLAKAKAKRIEKVRYVANYYMISQEEAKRLISWAMAKDE